MNGIFRFASTLAVLALSFALSAQTTTPPVSDGVCRKDHEVLEKMVRKSYKKTNMSSSDEQKAVISRDYIDNYLFAERDFNTKHLVTSLGGNRVYAEPSSVVVRANWAYPRREQDIGGHHHRRESLLEFLVVGQRQV